MKGKLFKTNNPLHPGRSVFDLSYSKLFTCDMGQLIPIMHDEVVPGDKFKIGNEIVVRMQPLVAPVLHEINVYVHYFFVPYRILWNKETDASGSWEEFISGGVDGTDASVLPRWTNIDGQITVSTNHVSLWDYFGLPCPANPTGAFPIDFPRRAYLSIWNNFYMDETLQDPIDIADITGTGAIDDQDTIDHFFIKRRNWEKDYFTSALLWQQRGTAPALPISGTSTAEWPSDAFLNSLASPGENAMFAHVDNGVMYLNDANSVASAQTFFADNEVDLSDATTFNVADLRLAFQVQKWLERNARSGVRYTEFLHSHFGVSPRDERLQRPEYIGGSKAPIIVSEVLQTSQSGTTPQGNMAGHGITASQQYCGEYFAQEYGIIMGIMSIMPKPMYQQGINRQWLRRTKYDFYFPEFAHLSEQAIEQAEIWINPAGGDSPTAMWGYQGRYDEMRYKPNLVCGDMRSTFSYWHLGRIFTELPALNEEFIQCNPDKRIFAVTTEPGFIVSFGNLIKAIRPLPIVSEPGLIDH